MPDSGGAAAKSPMRQPGPVGDVPLGGLPCHWITEDAAHTASMGRRAAPRGSRHPPAAPATGGLCTPQASRRSHSARYADDHKHQGTSNRNSLTPTGMQRGPALGGSGRGGGPSLLPLPGGTAIGLTFLTWGSVYGILNVPEGGSPPNGRGSPEKLEGDLIRQDQRCALGDQSMAEAKPLPRR